MSAVHSYSFSVLDVLDVVSFGFRFFLRLLTKENYFKDKYVIFIFF